MFEAAVENIALGGRIIAIGMVGSYTAGAGGQWAKSKHEARATETALKSACDLSLPAARP